MVMEDIKGGMGAVPGIMTAGIGCGIKKNGKKDLALIYSPEAASAAGVFTLNRVQAAPVSLCKTRLPSSRIRAVLINSGNANACTGTQGLQDALYLTDGLARRLGVDPETLLMCSTGVIGERLPREKIAGAFGALKDSLCEGKAAEAAEAILTTDTLAKEGAVRVETPGGAITLGGFAKGSGMICPQMATMLAFMATDAAVAPDNLQQALRDAARESFNRITVDGDMSTNDTVIFLANGRSGVGLAPGKAGWGEFCSGLDRVCRRLAYLIVKDGEGATKAVEIRVEEAPGEEEALAIARQIANSNLVKTAFFAADANWGRIVAAAGTAGVDIDPERLELSFDGVALVKGGICLGKEAEERVHQVLKQNEFALCLKLGLGDKKAVVWGNDLSYEYVRINADYRS